MTAPCKDCEKRHPNCHAHCEAYQAFRAENEKRYEANHMAAVSRFYKSESKARVLKKSKWRR